MNQSGDAAEQIVRMSLEGVEVAARISGAAAKEIALLLLAALKSPEKNQVGGLKLKGKARLESMLKSGKALEIFSVKERDLRTFAREAKRYGIVYCLLRDSKNTPDSLCDIMVKADDAPKINRIVERFQFAAVDQAGAAQSRDGQADRQMAEPTAAAPGEPAETARESTRELAQESTEINDVDQLLDEFLGGGENRPAPEQMKMEPEPSPEMEPEKSAMREAAQKEAVSKEAAQTDVGEAAPEDAAPANPSAALTAESRPSEPISENKSKSARDTFNKPSVKAELREITAARKDKSPTAPAREEASVPAPVPIPISAPIPVPVQGESKANLKIIHKQPAWDKSKKPIQTKGR